MLQFGNFVEWTSNATKRVVEDMGWHVSRFEANLETQKVTILVLDVLVEGNV